MYTLTPNDLISHRYAVNNASALSLFLHDQSNVDYETCIRNRIENDSYFVTLATILDLMNQTLTISGGTKETRKQMSQHLNDLKDECMYLQKHYTLTTKKGRG